VYCTGLVSATSQDLSLLECDIVLDGLLKTRVAVYPSTQLFLLQDFSQWQLCCESAQSHTLLACVVTSHAHGHVALVPSTVVAVSTLLHKTLQTVAVAALNIINALTTEFSLAVTQCSFCLAQLICLQLHKKFSVVYGTRRFIITLTMQVCEWCCNPEEYERKSSWLACAQ